MMLFVNDIHNEIPFLFEETNLRRSGSPSNSHGATTSLQSSVTCYRRKPQQFMTIRWYLRSNCYFNGKGLMFQRCGSRRPEMPISFCSRTGRSFEPFEFVGSTT